MVSDERGVEGPKWRKIIRRSMWMFPKSYISFSLQKEYSIARYFISYFIYRTFVVLIKNGVLNMIPLLDGHEEKCYRLEVLICLESRYENVYVKSQFHKQNQKFVIFQSFFNNPMTTWKSQRLQRELDLFGFPEFTCQFQLHNDTQVREFTLFLL